MELEFLFDLAFESTRLPQTATRCRKTHPLSEGGSFFQRQRVGLGDDRHDVDDVRELLQHDNVDGLEAAEDGSDVIWHCLASQPENIRVPRRLDEEETAVDAGILHVAFSVRRELLAEICRVLVLDVLDNGIPAGRVSFAGSIKPIDRESTICRCSRGRHIPACPQC